MSTGSDKLYNMVHKTECYAQFCEESDPPMSEYLYELARVIRVMDKNQKSLIKTLLRYQREKKILERLVCRLFAVMRNETDHIVDVWTGGGKDDPA